MNARRVLLIEDDPLSLKLMRDVLQAQGYAVTSTTNGHDGLAAAFSDSHDIVVIDIGIPGIDGVEVTRRIKADPAIARAPVLAVSAYAMPRDERRQADDEHRAADQGLGTRVCR